ncbi:MAG TPA: inositol monophosphatase family protein [Afifellaceae bacterium]|nr:inositol monophosphatase family protein [Afifellaceae bacterium]
MPRSALINVMVRAATKAGRVLSRDFGEVENLQVSRKGPADFVSASDRRAEEIIRAELERARPGYGFVMEEAGETSGSDPQHRWIVDPLDGTTNFLHGIPLFTVSIALERQGRLHAGLVYNPVSEELFTAERGAGAFLNDRRIRVAGRGSLAEAVVATGIPHLGRGDPGRFIKELAGMMGTVAGVRRTGAASLDLAWVAAGRFDGFWEHGLSAWDVAAGILLIREAGGFVSEPGGGDRMMESGSIVAGNETIHRQLCALLKG